MINFDFETSGQEMSCKADTGIREILESWALESRITAQGIRGIPLTIRIRKPMLHWQRLESSFWNPESMAWNPEFNTVKRHDWTARPPLETNELNGRISKGAKTWFPGIKSTQINEIWQGNDPLCEKKRRKSRQKNLLFCAWYLPIGP